MTIKSADEIRTMERTCRLAAQTLEYVGKHVRPGMTTNEIDQLVYDYTLTREALPSPLNYRGFPKSVCTSINDVVCHGVPDDTVLQEGDIINIDVTTFKDGFHGDTSATFAVGQISERARLLVEAAKAAMYKGIEAISSMGTTGDIGFAIDKFVTKQGYYVVREIGGHGIGREFHEDPFVPSFGKRSRGDLLRPGGTITVEPMVNETGAPLVEMAIAGSSIKYYVTSDKTLSAQFEHTVLITAGGAAEILTYP